MENLQANRPLLVDGLNEGFRAPDLVGRQSLTPDITLGEDFPE